MKKYTEQELEQIREEYMDKAAFTAPEEVTKAFNELHEAFNAYGFNRNSVLNQANPADTVAIHAEYRRQ